LIDARPLILSAALSRLLFPARVRFSSKTRPVISVISVTLVNFTFLTEMTEMTEVN
jgi:hypothetical protein